MGNTIEIFVPGVPAPGGSKKGFFNPKTKRVNITDASKKSKPWKAAVSAAAAEVVTAIMDGPLAVRMDFIIVRPKGHYRSGKNSTLLRDSAPQFPAVKPDVLKYSRSTEDALTGILWRDDSQIVTEFLTKRYGDQAGCLIRVKPEIV